MCSNSPQNMNILDRLRHVYTLPIMTKSSECSALTCVLEPLEDKRQPGKLFLLFTHYYSSLETAGPSLFPSHLQHDRSDTTENIHSDPDPEKNHGGVGCQEVTSSVNGQKLE